MLGKSFFGRFCKDAGGIEDCSRWLSEATPPDKKLWDTTPEWVAETGADIGRAELCLRPNIFPYPYYDRRRRDDEPQRYIIIYAAPLGLKRLVWVPFL